MAPKPYSNYSSPYATIPIFVLALSGKVAPIKDKDATKPEAESTKKAEAGRKKVFVGLPWVILGSVGGCVGGWVRYEITS